MIRFEIPSLPPSSNHAYFNLPGGGRALSTKGRKYKIETTAYLAQRFPQELRIFKPNKPYGLMFRFYFPELENGAKSRAKSRYKTFDGGNCTKLLEDVLKDAGGIDDSSTFVSAWQKECGPERTIVWAWSLEDESCPLHDLFRSLT